MEGKLDIKKIVKRASRNTFGDMDTRTKIVRDKTKYNRKSKHRKCLDI